MTITDTHIKALAQENVVFFRPNRAKLLGTLNAGKAWYNEMLRRGGERLMETPKSPIRLFQVEVHGYAIS